MKWEKIELLREKMEADDLNPEIGTGEFEHVRTLKGRITPWSLAEANFYGAAYTETHMKIALPLSFRIFPVGATHVKVYDPAAPIKIDRPLEIVGHDWRGGRYVTITCEAYRT